MGPGNCQTTIRELLPDDRLMGATLAFLRKAGVSKVKEGVLSPDRHWLFLRFLVVSCRVSSVLSVFTVLTVYW